MYYWFYYFIFSFLISAGITFFFVKLRKKTKKDVLKRLGGVGIIISFLFLILLNTKIEITPQVWVLIIGSVMILAFGIWDDFKNLSWKKQLVFQLTLCLLLIVFGINVDYFSLGNGQEIRLDGWELSVLNQSFSILGSFFIIFWLLGVINAVNWADGIDGLSGGIGILGGIAILLVSLRPEVEQPALAIISLIFIGSVLGFWWFNFSLAKIEAGTSGSYFIGFILAILAIMAGTKIATAMIVLALPLLDSFWVIISRFKNGRSIFLREKNNRHLHYQLKRIGWSDRKIFFGYFIFLSLMLFLSLILTTRISKISLLLVEILLIIFFILLVNVKANKLKANQPK